MTVSKRLGPGEVGEMVLVRYSDPADLTDRLVIKRADPRVWITDEMLTQIRHGSPFATYSDGVLTVTGEDSEFIYRTVYYDHQRNQHLMEWPD